MLNTTFKAQLKTFSPLTTTLLINSFHFKVPNILAPSSLSNELLRYYSPTSRYYRKSQNKYALITLVIYENFNKCRNQIWIFPKIQKNVYPIFVQNPCNHITTFTCIIRIKYKTCQITSIRNIFDFSFNFLLVKYFSQINVADKLLVK